MVPCVPLRYATTLLLKSVNPGFGLASSIILGISQLRRLYRYIARFCVIFDYFFCKLLIFAMGVCFIKRYKSMIKGDLAKWPPCQQLESSICAQ